MTDRPAGLPGDDRDGAPAAGLSAADAPEAPDAAAPTSASALTPPLGTALIELSPTAAAVTTRTGSWFAGLDPRGWRTTLVVAALMVGAVVGANLVNAAVPLPEEPAIPDVPAPTIPGADPGPVEPGPVEPPADAGPVTPGSPVEVGHGLVLYPPAGWTVVAAETGSVALQKGGVILLALATPWEGDPASLADTYAQAFFAEGQFQSATPKTGTLGNGVPSVVIGWSGIVDGSQYDGAIAAGVASGTGMVLNAIAPKGQFQGVADDLDAIGETLQIVPGGEG